MKLYLAGPMFSFAERQWNNQLAEFIRNLGYEVFVPQERDANMHRQQSDHDAANQAIFEDDREGVRDCDVLLANLDGNVVDDGTAVEIGMAYAMGKTVLAINTDFRQWAPNLMIVGCLSAPVFRTLPDLLDHLERIPQMGDRPQGDPGRQ